MPLSSLTYTLVLVLCFQIPPNITQTALKTTFPRCRPKGVTAPRKMLAKAPHGLLDKVHILEGTYLTPSPSAFPAVSPGTLHQAVHPKTLEMSSCPLGISPIHASIRDQSLSLG